MSMKYDTVARHSVGNTNVVAMKFEKPEQSVVDYTISVHLCDCNLETMQEVMQEVVKAVKAKLLAKVIN